MLSGSATWIGYGVMGPLRLGCHNGPPFVIPGASSRPRTTPTHITSSPDTDSPFELRLMNGRSDVDKTRRDTVVTRYVSDPTQPPSTRRSRSLLSITPARQEILTRSRHRRERHSSTNCRCSFLGGYQSTAVVSLAEHPGPAQQHTTSESKVGPFAFQILRRQRLAFTSFETNRQRHFNDNSFWRQAYVNCW